MGRVCHYSKIHDCTAGKDGRLSTYTYGVRRKAAIFFGIITYESYKHVVPDYYDIVLKTKTSRDADSEAMIDLIRDTIHIDFGYIHSTALNGVGHLFVNQVRNKSANIASAFKSAEKKATQQLEDILAFYYSDN